MKRYHRAFLGLGLMFGMYRLRYFVGYDIPLGYDPGMYKGIFVVWQHILSQGNLSLLPGWVRHEPLLGVLMGALGNIGFSFDWLLTWGIGILSLLPGIIIFLLFRKQNLRIAILSAVFYWVSITQYEVFWRGYLKQIMGVSLMLGVLRAWEHKLPLWQGIFFFVIIILHKHTALYTGAILASMICIDMWKNKHIPWKYIGIFILAGILGLVAYLPFWNNIFPEAIKAAQTTFAGTGTGGDFLTRFLYFKYQWLVVLCSLRGFWKTIRAHKRDVRTIGYIVGGIWLVLGLVNFNRTLVFWDIFVCIMAARGILEILSSFGLKSKIGVLGVFCLITGVGYILHITTTAQPLISPDEFTAIKTISTLTESNAIIMTTHKNYTPWMMGRSQRDYINPGMADLDTWNHATRIQRWASTNNQKCTMLESSYKHLNRPLYIWQGSQQASENISGENCFHLYATGTSRQMRNVKF
ncbi:MAG: hypothetical protein WCO66_03370 [Candidatus Absconditabacteria bacterium]